jgi:hypothetical protein
MMVWILFAGCFLGDDYPEPNCAARLPYYPDEDGDGLGEPTAVFFGCEAPDGWVPKLEPAESGDTGDSGP